MKISPKVFMFFAMVLFSLFFTHSTKRECVFFPFSMLNEKKRREMLIKFELKIFSVWQKKWALEWDFCKKNVISLTNNRGTAERESQCWREGKWCEAKWNCWHLRRSMNFKTVSFFNLFPSTVLLGWLKMDVKNFPSEFLEKNFIKKSNFPVFSVFLLS